MQVSRVLNSKGPDSEVITVPPDADVATLVTLLGRHRVGALVVSPDGRQVAGIVSERDVIGALAVRGAAVLTEPVSSICTSAVHTASHETTVQELMRVMTQARVRHIPVLDAAGLLVGIVSIGDVVKNHIDDLASERDALQDYVSGPR